MIWTKLNISVLSVHYVYTCSAVCTQLYNNLQSSYRPDTHKHTDITLYTPPALHFVSTGAHTFLGPVILMLILVEYTI